MVGHCEFFSEWYCVDFGIFYIIVGCCEFALLGGGQLQILSAWQWLNAGFPISGSWWLWVFYR